MDDETFQKMVDRQYEMLRRDRIKGFEDQKSKLEENGSTDNEPTVTAAPNTEDAQPREVCLLFLLRFNYMCYYVEWFWISEMHQLLIHWSKRYK